MAGGAALALLLLAGGAAAQPRTYNIPAESLSQALRDYGRQTGQQLIFTEDLVRGRTVAGLRGAMEPGAALSSLLAGSGLHAQTSPNGVVMIERDAGPPGGAAAGAAAEPAQVSEVTVTGTHIRGAPPAAPVLTMTHDDMERSGQDTLVDALRALPQNFGGLAGEGNTLTGSDGVGRNVNFGSAVNLRGLGNSATLVLVDGHRVAGSGSFGDYVDISTLPTAAVERTEILLDGASAVYGSDAVAGVVNILLRKDFDGAELRVLGGTSTAGGASEARVAATFGRRWSGGGAIFSYEFADRARLLDADRPFAATADLRPYGGTDFRITNAFPGNILGRDPVTNGLVPLFGIPPGQNGVGLRPSDLVAGVINRENQREGEDILPHQTFNSGYLAAHQDIGDHMSVFADARYSRRRFRARFAEAVSTFSVGRNNPFYVAPTGAATESIAYDFAGDVPNPESLGKVEVAAVTAGSTLDLVGDWRGKATATFAQETSRFIGRNFIDSLFLNEALGNTPDNPATPFSTARDGFFNPFSGAPGANSRTIDQFIGAGATTAYSRDRFYSVDLQADGTLLHLPGGPVKLAVGGQAKREELFRLGTNMLSTLTPVSISNATNAYRDVLAAFAEARVPIVGSDNAVSGIQRLELSLSARVEHYKTFGTTTNPSFGVTWTPVNGLQLRSTYSRSFRAPALRELYDPAGVTPTLLSQSGASVRTLTLTGGNPGLSPETASSWTVGADFKPAFIPGLQVSVTGYDVRFRNRIDRPASVNLANALVDPSLSAFVRHISPNTNASDLALINALLVSAPFVSSSGSFPPTDYGAVVDIRYVNTATLRVRGVDVTGSYVVDLGDDRLTFGGNASYVLDYDQQFTPTSAVISRVNVANFPLRFRSRLTADWTRGRLTLGGAFNYTGAYHDTVGTKIDQFGSFDLQARLAPADQGLMKGLSVLFNVRNLLDKAPPFYNNSQGFAYDPANADPIGRFVSVQLIRKW